MSDRSLDRAAVRDRVASLPEEQVETLLKETRDILDAHAEIQQEHRDQAKWVLRVYAPGVGLLIAAFAWIWGQFRTILATEVSVPDGTVALGVYVVFALLSTVGLYLLIRSFFRFVGILELVAAVLTPREFEIESWPIRGLRLIPWYETAGEVDTEGPANETVERVVEAERLLNSTKQPPIHAERTLVDRLCRIRRNERSINRDMAFLRTVYRAMSTSLADALAGGVVTALAIELPPLFT